MLKYDPVGTFAVHSVKIGGRVMDETVVGWNGVGGAGLRVGMLFEFLELALFRERMGECEILWQAGRKL